MLYESSTYYLDYGEKSKMEVHNNGYDKRTKNSNY